MPEEQRKTIQDRHDDPLLAVLWVEYPDQVRMLSEHEAFFVHFDDELSGFSNPMTLHAAVDDASDVRMIDGFKGRLFVSLRFHYGSEHLDYESRYSRRTTDLMAKVAPSLQQHPQGAFGNHRYHYTVVEMVSPLAIPAVGDRWLPTINVDAAMGPTITRCFEALIQFMESYRLATERLMPAPARERLGPILFGGIRRADDNTDTWYEQPREILNAYATNDSFLSLKDPPADLRELMKTSHLFRTIQHPAHSLKELQLEAKTARVTRGDFRSAVMHIHAASEVLLDTALMGMLFEEGTQVQDAAKVLSEGLVHRVRSEYHGRLGGSWNPDMKGVVRNWVEKLVWLRNRVVHFGYTPTREESDGCQDVYEAMRGFVIDRLAERTKQFPLTSGVLVGKAGFARRGIDTHASQRAVAVASKEVYADLINWMRDVRVARAS